MAGRRLLILLAVFGVLLGAAAGADILPRGRELEQLALIRALGADARGNGVRMTAASGVQREQQGAKVYSADGETVSGACLALQAEGGGAIFYGQTQQLLLGEELARRSVIPPLEYILRDVELRLGTELYLVRGGTAQGLLTRGEREGDSVKRLETMAQDADLLANSMPRTVGEVMESLSRSGAAVVPGLVWNGDIAAAGYGIVKGEKLAGWTRGEEAYGVNLALGQVDADIVEIPWGGGSAALRVVGVRTWVRPAWENGKLSRLTLYCDVESDLAESAPGLDLTEPGLREEMERLLAETERARIAAALDRCRELDADCLELGVRAALGCPMRSKAVMEQFSIGNTPVDVAVEAHIGRSYDTRR